MSMSEELISCLEGEIVKRDALIAELESERSDPEFSPKYARRLIAELRAELDAPREQVPVAWNARFKEDKFWGICSKEHYELVTRCSKEWPGYEVRQLYAAPVAKPQVVMPERRTKADYSCYIGEFANEAAAIHNAALDAVIRLNAADQEGGQDE
jgi:hypothetical protein